MYGLIRNIIFLVIAIFVCNYIRKSKIVRKKLTIVVAVILCAILCTLSALLPVENLFISFPSPQAVYDYYGYGEIEVLIEGKDSCLVFNDRQLAIIPKSEDGYKIFTCFSEKLIARRFDKQGSFSIYQAKGTNDYYVTGSLSNKKDNLTISDNSGSNMYVKTTQNEYSEYNIVQFYGLINNYTEGYSIIVDGKNIFIP